MPTSGPLVSRHTLLFETPSATPAASARNILPILARCNCSR
jgi:hypothetical protein